MTNSTSTSDIYLKKSELPQNVSAFKNDAQYISSTSLDNWLKTHSYLSKEEVVALINSANLIITDKINATFDESAVGRLDTLISAMQGEITELKEKLNKISAETDAKISSWGEEDGKDYYISKDKENTFATKTDIESLDDRLSDIEASLSNGSTTPSEPSVAPSEPVDLSAYATKEWVGEQGYFRTHQDISGKADKSYVDEKIADSISGKVDKSYVDEKIAEAKAEIPSLAGYATEEWVGEQGYFRVHQDISGKADKSYVDEKIAEAVSSKTDKSYVDQKVSEAKTAIPSLDGYATEEWVKNQKYVTSASMSSTLSKYAKASTTYDKRYIDSTFIDIHEIQDYAKKEDIESTYLPKKDIASTYITKRDASNTYLTKEDYRGLKSAATISDAYANKTYKDILADLDKGLTLLDGFYVTKDDDGNITYMLIKNNELQVYQGGNVTVRPEWEEED